MIEAYFGQNFKIEDGKVVARNAAGNEIYSPSNPGTLAEFDEALQILVEGSPFKEQILKGTNKSGTGATGPGEGGSGKSISRDEFQKIAMDDPARASKMMLEDKVEVVYAA